MTEEITLPAFAIGAINLASPRLGSDVIYATDDFFADKSRLLKVEEPVFIADKYDEHGKWMDGWESKRRRIPGNDHCIVRLGAKGVITGVDINTSHFTGNHPPQGSIEGALTDAEPDENTAWSEILPISDLNADSHNFFETSTDAAYNYLRFNIFPDGGVARLRVYGNPVCEWKRQDPNGLQELSAVVNGGNIVGFNDAHYGDPWVILAPGRGVNMGDGWETRRRRDPGNDWIVVSLGAAGTVERIEVDTAHFKGNYPDRCSVQAALVENPDDEDLLTDECRWQNLMGEQKLEMDRIHNFEGDLINKLGVVSHVRLNIFPDGGVSRFRIFGKLAKDDA
ncbi:MAG: allantoicase [Rhodospirillaceae bacterium]|jgi:allantoicase|nr:allantoicase [Rhodospirillaceae bacterium]MBT7266910.1 allantoicase [Rhodospirillaceae bacterium]